MRLTNPRPHLPPHLEEGTLRGNLARGEAVGQGVFEEVVPVLEEHVHVVVQLGVDEGGNQDNGQKKRPEENRVVKTHRHHRSHCCHRGHVLGTTKV